MEELSDVHYDDILKEELYLLNDDINSQDYVATCLVMLLGFSPIDAMDTIQTIENVGRAKIKEAYYYVLLDYKNLLDDLNLKTEIE
jgi:ATP-dependent Clp protease adapter protein ClpS